MRCVPCIFLASITRSSMHNVPWTIMEMCARKEERCWNPKPDKSIIICGRKQKANAGNAKLYFVPTVSLHLSAAGHFPRSLSISRCRSSISFEIRIIGKTQCSERNESPERLVANYYYYIIFITPGAFTLAWVRSPHRRASPHFMAHYITHMISHCARKYVFLYRIHARTFFSRSSHNFRLNLTTNRVKN